MAICWHVAGSDWCLSFSEQHSLPTRRKWVAAISKTSSTRKHDDHGCRLMYELSTVKNISSCTQAVMSGPNGRCSKSVGKVGEIERNRIAKDTKRTQYSGVANRLLLGESRLPWAHAVLPEVREMWPLKCGLRAPDKIPAGLLGKLWNRKVPYPTHRDHALP
jgi:hypothetical protein